MLELTFIVTFISLSVCLCTGFTSGRLGAESLNGRVDKVLSRPLGSKLSNLRIGGPSDLQAAAASSYVQALYYSTTTCSGSTYIGEAWGVGICLLITDDSNAAVQSGKATVNGNTITFTTYTDTACSVSPTAQTIQTGCNGGASFSVSSAPSWPGNGILFS